MTDEQQQTIDSMREWYGRTCTATVYVPTIAASEHSDEDRTAQTDDVAELVAEVADASTAERVIDALTSVTPIGGGLVAVVDDNQVQVWQIAAHTELSVHPGPLPALGRLVAARQTWVPHALVLVDQVGADITIVTAVGADHATTVDGATSHITKSNPGGWSQKRYQQRAEEHWHDNAKLVAERLTAEVDGSDIDLVLVSGNDQMISILTESLPQRITEKMVDLKSGGRAEDGSQEQVDKAVDQAVRHAAHRRRVQAGEAISEAIGRGVGATGRTDVLQALFEGGVDKLVIELASTAEMFAHVGPEPAQVAADSGILHALDLDASRVPLADAAIRAGLATGADITVVQKSLLELTDGLGASLRGGNSV